MINENGELNQLIGIRTIETFKAIDELIWTVQLYHGEACVTMSDNYDSVGHYRG